MRCSTLLQPVCLVVVVHTDAFFTLNWLFSHFRLRAHFSGRHNFFVFPWNPSLRSFYCLIYLFVSVHHHRSSECVAFPRNELSELSGRFPLGPQPEALIRVDTGRLTYHFNVGSSCDFSITVIALSHCLPLYHLFIIRFVVATL